MALSALNHLAFKEETTFGTAVTPDIAYPIESEDLRVEGGIGSHGPVQANRASAIKPFAARKSYPGTINTFIYPEEFGWLLKGLFGSVSSTSVDSGVYQHTFSITNGSLPSFTIEKYSQNVTERFAGVRISAMEFNFRNDEEVTVAIDVQGKTRDTDTAISPSWPTVGPFVAVDTSVKMASDKSSLSGATADSDIQDLTLRIDNNLEVLYGLDGSQDPARIETHRLAVSGSFNKYFSDTTELDAFLNRTQKALGIYLSGETITGGYTYDLQFELADIRFTSVAIPTGVDDIIVATCEFTGFYDTNESEVIEAILQNGTNSY